MGCANSSVSKDEVEEYIETHASLWAMLSVNLGIGEEECKLIASQVIIDIGTDGRGLKEKDGRQALTSAEWRSTKDYLSDPKGALDFFHRTVFGAFDSDKNGVLDRGELDKFLNIYYEGHSIFAGDSRLPPKEELKELVYAELDKNSDGQLEYSELRPLISGKVQLGNNKNTI